MFDGERPATDQVYPEPDSGRYVLHVHRSADVWTWACAIAAAAELRRALAAEPRARLLLGYGEALVPIYRALARAPLAWERTDVSLLDERWLLPDDPDSHAWQLRSHLLRHHAATARFEPLTRAGRSIPESIATANMHARHPAAVAIFGMGNDGHIASLFPRMADLDRIMSSREAYAAVDATGCPAALNWGRRITTTPKGLARIGTRLLALRGRESRTALEYAIESGNDRSWPVLAALEGASPLQIHWCA